MPLKISIIVPFYNRLHLLEKTITSVIRQNCTDWELILVDDGSEEDTRLIQKTYASDKVRFLKREGTKKGAPVCRNIGARKAHGTHLLFLDSDDLLGDWAINDRLSIIRQNESADLYIFEGLEFDNNSPESHRLRTLFECQDPLKQFLRFQSVWQTSCIVWAPALFESITGWDESAHSWQDGEIHIRALLKKPKTVWGNELPDVFIRKHADQHRISNLATIEKLTNRYDTYNSVKSHLSESPELYDLFSKNTDNALFTEVEGMDHKMIKEYAEWVRSSLPSGRLKRNLLWYIRMYRAFGQNSTMKRVLYQMRKIGIPNKRLPQWSIRPKLSEELERALSRKARDSEHLNSEIKYLGKIAGK